MARSSKPVLEKLEDVKPGDFIPYDEYKGYMIITEQSGRVVVAERGLYCDEFNNVDKAKEYIDAIR